MLKKNWIGIALAGLALVAVALGVALSGGDRAAVPSGAAGSDSAHARPAAMRTLMVSARREPAPSLPGSTMRALRMRGPVPVRAAVGTVMSDEDCAADARGVSHCVNRIRLASGHVLTVRHPHRMADVPCMTPGERLMVRAV